MGSTFRRRTTSAGEASNHNNSTVLQYRGTKPWTGGIQLTSSGLRELDAILGGGQPLASSILLVNEERFTDLTDCICRYWIAEGVSQRQRVMLLPMRPDVTCDTVCKDNNTYHGGYTATHLRTNFMPSLPMNMHHAKHVKQVKQQNDAAGEGVKESSQFSIIEEEDDDDDEVGAAAEEGLQIAWQYRLDIQNERNRIDSSSSSRKQAKAANGPSVYCHSFDLGNSLQDDLYLLKREGEDFDDDDDNKSVVYIPNMDDQNLTEPHMIFRHLMKRIRDALLQCRRKDSVLRVLLLDMEPNSYSVVIPLLLTSIRASNLPVCILCSVRTSCWQNHRNNYGNHTAALTQLKRVCDVVLSIDSFVGYGEPPPEFRELVGILNIEKLGGQMLGQFSDRFALANRYGLKRDRRKLHIQMLHLPPEDMAQGGSSVGGGVRSGGGAMSDKAGKGPVKKTGCGTSASSLLDF